MTQPILTHQLILIGRLTLDSVEGTDEYFKDALLRAWADLWRDNRRPEIKPCCNYAVRISIEEIP